MGRTKRYAERINILKKVRINQSWRLVAVTERNGKVIRDHVWVGGKDEHHPEGRYYVEWYECGKRKRQSIPEFEQVVEAARRKSIEIQASKVGIVSREIVPSELRITIAKALDDYLQYVQVHRSHRTFLTYRHTLDCLLRQSYAKEYVDEVERLDILNFITDCYRLGLSGRTTYDKLVVVLQFFKHWGKTKLIAAKDWPAYVETIRPIYEAEEIELMIRHAEPDEALFLKFLLASGFRDREVRCLTWRDMDFRNSCVRVTAKALWDFRPKNWEERAVPIPSSLLQQLRELKERKSALPSTGLPEFARKSGQRK